MPIRYFKPHSSGGCSIPRLALCHCWNRPMEARHVAKLAPFCERVEWAVIACGPKSSAARDFSGNLLQVSAAVTWPYASRSLEISCATWSAPARSHILQIEHSFLAHFRDAVPRARAVGRSLVPQLLRDAVPHMLQHAIGAGGEAGFGWSRRSSCALGGPTCAAFSTGVWWFRNRGPAPVRGWRPAPPCRSSPTAWIPRLCVRCPGRRRQRLISWATCLPAQHRRGRFLAHHILPALRARIPEARLTVVATGRPACWASFRGRDDIDLVGRVPLRFLLPRRACRVCSLRAGGGTASKILEAMALGRPVVSTPLGCEGLASSTASTCSSPSDAEDFARSGGASSDRPRACHAPDPVARALVERDYIGPPSQSGC